MKKKYRILGMRRRCRVREIAREAFIQDPNNAEQIAILSLRREFNSIISAILIGIMIELVKELILHWLFNGCGSPDVGFQPGEPGADE